MQEKFDKPDDYYKAIRSDLLRLIPQDADIKRVLDIGCGAGGNASILRMMGVEYIAGVEINPDIAELAKKVMDCVIVASIEDTGKLSFKPESFDLIICGDVLEHLVNPWKVLVYLRSLLSSNGLLLVSIPNIRNWIVIWNLIVKGQFKYEKSGILDITHLRFRCKNPPKKLQIDINGGGNLSITTNHRDIAKNKKQ